MRTDLHFSTGKQKYGKQTNLSDMLEMKLSWEGEGIHEKARDESGNIVVAVDRLYFRPAEVETLLGDPTRVREQLGWAPRISFPELVREMVESDYQAARRDGFVRAHGYEAYSFNESEELAFQKELF
jgi:GDPmannose 4,6-dehydratase